MARLSIPAQKPRLSFTINDFSGGLVNNVNDTKMRDNQSPDMLNMQFRVDGLLQKRPGTVFLGSSPFSNDLIDIIPYEYQPNQIELLYLSSDGLYYQPFYGVFKRIWGNVGLELRYAHFMGELFFSDGLNLFSYKRDDSKEQKDLIRCVYKYDNPPNQFVPAPKPAVTGVHKTELLGTIKKVFGSENDVVINKGSSADGLTIDEVSYYKKWYEPCEFEMEDGFKGTNMLPPNIDCLAVHKDRIYISGGAFAPNMVWISDILNPSYFPASLPIQTPPDDDYITALHVYNDDLIIGRRDSIYALFGNTNRNDSVEQYRLMKVNSHTGMANNRSGDSIYHMFFFAGSDGNFYKLSPPSANADTLYTAQLNTKLDITLPPFNLTVDSLDYAHTIFDGANGLWYVQIADHTLVYSYQLMAWTRYSRIDATSFFKINQEVCFARATGSYYRFADREANQKYYDEYFDIDANKMITLPVVAYWTSRNMDMGIPSQVKQFRDTYVTSESFDNYDTTVNIKYEVDYVDIAQTYKIVNEVSRWDRAAFDVSRFASRNIDVSLPLMINRRGRTIKVHFGCGYEYWGSMPFFPVPGIIPEYSLVYVTSENKLYLRVPRREGFDEKKDKYFMEFPESEMNQALLVHNIMGIYELKGYR